MATADDKNLTFREQRALYFARTPGRTKMRIWFLYLGAAFFAFNAIASTLFIEPLTLWDFSGFLFLAAAFWAANSLRKLLNQGQQMLAERGEVIDVRSRPAEAKTKK